MKKLFFLLISCMVSFGAFAQEKADLFVLKPSGLEFSTAPASTNDYVVLEFEGKPKADLYKAVMVYLNRVYKSADNVVSSVQDESITINGFAPKSVRRTDYHKFDMNYRLNLEFKDNKIKVDLPTFELTTSDYTNPQVLELVANNALDGSVLGIWNTKGKLKSELAKEDIETFFEMHIADMVSSITNESSDW